MLMIHAHVLVVAATLAPPTFFSPQAGGAEQDPPPERRFRLPDWSQESWWLRRHTDAPWALTGVNVIDIADGSIRANVNMIVRGDVVESIGDEPVPAGTEAVDASGKFVIPGLFDLHAHVIPKWDRFPTSKEPEETLRDLINAGVTTIRLIPLYNESAIHFAAEVNRGAITGPTIVPTSSVFEKEPGRTFIGFSDAETARAWVRKEALLGARWIKIYDNMDEECLSAIIEEAEAHGMRICGHASKVPPHRAAELGMHCIEHAISLAWSCLREGIEIPKFALGQRFDEIGWYWAHVDETKCEALLRRFVEHGTAWVPTLVVIERIVELGAHDERGFTDPATRERLAAALDRAARMAAQMHRMGGLVGVGSDFPIDGVEPGTSVHREMELLVERGGATPLEAMQIATVGSARILGFEDILGAVEPGMIANFIVLDANPLENISATRDIHMVVHDGRRYAPGEDQ